MSGETCVIIAKAGGGKTHMMLSTIATQLRDNEPTLLMNFETTPKQLEWQLDLILDSTDDHSDLMPLVCWQLQDGTPVDVIAALQAAESKFIKEGYGGIRNIYLDGCEFLKLFSNQTPFTVDLDGIESFIRNALNNGNDIRLVMTKQANRHGLNN